jgi:TatD DNase family protein
MWYYSFYMMHYALFDIHAHMHDTAYDEDREVVLKEMKDYGLGAITVGTDQRESQKAFQLAENNTHMYAAVGLHPADSVAEEFDYEFYKTLAQNEKVVAIGECGLDYHYIDTFFKRDVEAGKVTWNKDAEVDRQQRIFEQQVELAVEVNKPLMLHGRPTKGTMDAYEDMLHILENAKKKHGTLLRGNAHFFVGNIDIAERFVQLGFTMSFSGVITFTKDYDDVVRYLPSTMIQAETDSPYATPAPFRGKRNSPMYVQEVVARIAVLRNEPLEEVRVQLLENAKRIFSI